MASNHTTDHTTAGNIPPSAWDPVQRATGISRDEWLAFYAPHQEKDHTELATLTLQHLKERAETSPELAKKNLEWWAQNVTVAFEQHIGRRKVNQRCDGSFGANASKTVAGEPRDIAKKWGEWAADNLPFAIKGPARESATEKWNYWRATGADGAAIIVNINSRSAGKTTLAFEATGLNSSEQSAQFKALFKQTLAEFARTV